MTSADKSPGKSSVDQEESLLFRVGDRVVVLLNTPDRGDEDEYGTVRWIGVLPDDNSKNISVGVEFDNPVGTGTGKYKQHRLFFTKLGYASLVPAAALMKEETFRSDPAGSSQRLRATSGESTTRTSTLDTGLKKQIPRNGDQEKSLLDKTDMTVCSDDDFKTVEPASLSATSAVCNAPKTKLDKQDFQMILKGTTADNSRLRMLSVGDTEVKNSSAAVADLIPTERECSVCHEDFTEPKVLPCAHLLCRGCLMSLMKKEANCPLCRHPIVIQTEKTGMKLEDIADSFFTDHHMMALVKAASFLSKQHACKVCVNVAAVFLCLTCGDELCSSCTSAHRKLSATSHHSVEALDTLTPEQLAAERTVTCANHTNRPSDLFCQTHNIFICFPCAKADHRKCAEIRYLEEQKEENQKLVADLTKTLSEAETKLTQKLSQLDRRLVHIEEKEMMAVAYVDEKCNRLAKAIQACRSRLREQVLDKCSSKKRSVMEEKSSLQNERGRLTSHRQMLRRIYDLPALDDVSKLRRTVQRCVDSLEHVDESEDQNWLHLTFTVDEGQLSKVEQDLSCLQID